MLSAVPAHGAQSPPAQLHSITAQREGKKMACFARKDKE